MNRNTIISLNNEKKHNLRTNFYKLLNNEAE